MKATASEGPGRDVTDEFDEFEPEPSSTGELDPSEVLSAEEVEGVLGLLKTGSPTATRNRALLAVLFGSGLRTAEALALRPKDVDIEGGKVHVRSGKGGRARTVALSREVAPYVQDWLHRRRALGINGRHHLFCTISKGNAGVGDHHKATEPGKPLFRLGRTKGGRKTAQPTSYIRRWAMKLEEKAHKRGVTQKRFHLHALRHAHATHLHGAGWTVGDISKQLGHRSVRTTFIYLERLGLDVDGLAEKMSETRMGLSGAEEAPASSPTIETLQAQLAALQEQLAAVAASSKPRARARAKKA